MEAVSTIKRMATSYMTDIYGLSKYQRIQQFDSLMTQMQIFAGKYGFTEYLKNEKIDGFSFSEVKDILEGDDDPEILLKGCQIAFTLFESILKKLGVGFPTHTFRAEVKIDISAFRAISSL
jgi:hypothetical protein